MKSTFAWLVLLIASAATASVLAQDAKPDVDNAPAPRKGTAADRKANELSKLTQDKNPIVQAILESRPETPFETLRAVMSLVDLRHAPEAKPFLTKLLGAKLDDETLIGIYREFGNGPFLKLALNPQLQPEGTKFADAVFAAVNKAARDPARLKRAIGQLLDPNSRYVGLREVQTMGAFGVNGLLGLLTDAQPKDRAVVIDTLVQLGTGNAPQLAAALNGNSEPMLAGIAEVLGKLDAREQMPFLFAPALSDGYGAELKGAAQAALDESFGRVPTKAQAAAYLYRAGLEQYNRQQPQGLTPEVPIWLWDAKSNAAVEQVVPADVAAAMRAARLARAAYRIVPDHTGIQHLYLETMLEAAAYQIGHDKPLSEVPEAVEAAKQLGVTSLVEVLAESLKTGHFIAARGAAQILGEIGTVEILTRDVQPSPLAMALKSPDRRLRFAAVEAILKIGPRESYAGSSFLPLALDSLITGLGNRRALAVANTSEQASVLAAPLIEMGYKTDIATDTISALRILKSSTDYELAYIMPNMNEPTTFDFLTMLRNDFRTLKLPVAIWVMLENPLRTERLVRDFSRCVAVTGGRDRKTTEFQLAPLLVPLDGTYPSAKERESHALAALAWTARLAATDVPALYDLKRLETALVSAVNVPALAGPAAAALAELGTPASQRTLLDLANRDTATVEIRELAIGALQRAVDKCGVLLTTGELLRQYDRYNASAKADRQTQALLGSILDVLESKVAPQAAAPAQQNMPAENNPPAEKESPAEKDSPAEGG